MAAYNKDRSGFAVAGNFLVRDYVSQNAILQYARGDPRAVDELFALKRKRGITT